MCTHTLPDPGEHPSTAAIDAARTFFRGQDVVVEPRKIWASGLPDRKGKIGFLQPGRALAFADDPAWSGDLAELWRTDRAAPQAILDGMVEVLKRWSRSWQRPTAVVAMPSRRYPALVHSVAAHLAEIGRLPLVDALEVTGPPPDADGSSATRAKDLIYRTTLRPGVALDGPVLLVDDVIRSRWTVTVAGALLADAGARSVLPLAVHQRP